MSVSAQITSASPATIQRNTEGRILQPAQPSSSPLTPAVSASRPDRNERALPPEVKEKLKQFEAAREAFINRQEQLRRQMDGAAGDKEREAIRQRIKESLDQWRDQARQFRDEARERVKELQRELPSLREALQEGPGTGTKPGGRPRPGTD